MDPDAIIQYIRDTFADVDVLTVTEGIAAGDTFFMYDPDQRLDPKHRFPFATIVTKDYGDFDCASNLNRPGVFRLNVGVSRDTYRSLFGPPPAPPGAGVPVSTGHDFTTLDQLLPHPVYAPQSWVCVLNPSAETFESVQPLLAEAYQRAVARHARGQTTREEEA
ncbi:MAG TPA: DUF6194 family protein [Chloroflexota bacterium]|nr:DUF6194 family protein [Chloroflexota bacterium]